MPSYKYEITYEYVLLHDFQYMMTYKFVILYFFSLDKFYFYTGMGK